MAFGGIFDRLREWINDRRRDDEPAPVAAQPVAARPQEPSGPKPGVGLPPAPRRVVMQTSSPTYTPGSNVRVQEPAAQPPAPRIVGSGGVPGVNELGQTDNRTAGEKGMAVLNALRPAQLIRNIFPRFSEVRDEAEQLVASRNEQVTSTYNSLPPEEQARVYEAQMPAYQASLVSGEPATFDNPLIRTAQDATVNRSLDPVNQAFFDKYGYVPDTWEGPAANAALRQIRMGAAESDDYMKSQWDLWRAEQELLRNPAARGIHWLFGGASLVGRTIGSEFAQALNYTDWARRSAGVTEGNIAERAVEGMTGLDVPTSLNSAQTIYPIFAFYNRVLNPGLGSMEPERLFDIDPETGETIEISPLKFLSASLFDPATARSWVQNHLKVQYTQMDDLNRRIEADVAANPELREVYDQGMAVASTADASWQLRMVDELNAKFNVDEIRRDAEAAAAAGNVELATELNKRATYLDSVTYNDIIQQNTQLSSELVAGILLDPTNVLDIVTGAGAVTTVAKALDAADIATAVAKGTDTAEAITRGVTGAARKAVDPWSYGGPLASSKFPLVAKTPDALASIDGNIVYSGLRRLTNDVDNAEDARFLLDSIVENPQQFLTPVPGLTSAGLRAVADEAGEVSFSALSVLDKQFMDRHHILQLAAPQFAEMKSLQAATFNPDHFRAELEAIVENTAAKVHGLAPLMDLPYGAAEMRLAGNAVEFLDEAGAVISVKRYADAGAALTAKNEITDALSKVGGRSKVMGMLRWPDRIQRNVMTRVWLNLSPRTMIRNAIGWSAAAGLEGVYTFKHMDDIIDRLKQTGQANIRAERAIRDFIEGSKGGYINPQGGVSAGRSERTTRFGRAMENLWNGVHWTQNTNIAGRIGIGEQSGYIRSYSAGFDKTFNALWDARTKSNGDLYNQAVALGLPPSEAARLVNVIRLTGKAGSKQDVMDAVKAFVSYSPPASAVPPAAAAVPPGGAIPPSGSPPVPYAAAVPPAGAVPPVGTPPTAPAGAVPPAGAAPVAAATTPTAAPGVSRATFGIRPGVRARSAGPISLSQELPPTAFSVPRWKEALSVTNAYNSRLITGEDFVGYMNKLLMDEAVESADVLRNVPDVPGPAAWMTKDISEEGAALADGLTSAGRMAGLPKEQIDDVVKNVVSPYVRAEQTAIDSIVRAVREAGSENAPLAAVNAWGRIYELRAAARTQVDELLASLGGVRSQAAGQRVLKELSDTYNRLGVAVNVVSRQASDAIRSGGEVQSSWWGMMDRVAQYDDTLLRQSGNFAGELAKGDWEKAVDASFTGLLRSAMAAPTPHGVDVLAEAMKKADRMGATLAAHLKGLYARVDAGLLDAADAAAMRADAYTEYYKAILAHNQASARNIMRFGTKQGDVLETAEGTVRAFREADDLTNVTRPAPVGLVAGSETPSVMKASDIGPEASRYFDEMAAVIPDAKALEHDWKIVSAYAVGRSRATGLPVDHYFKGISIGDTDLGRGLNQRFRYSPFLGERITNLLREIKTPLFDGKMAKRRIDYLMGAVGEAGKFPDYLLRRAEWMLQQQEKFRAKQFTGSDIAKAHILAIASQQASHISLEKFFKQYGDAVSKISREGGQYATELADVQRDLKGVVQTPWGGVPLSLDAESPVNKRTFYSYVSTENGVEGIRPEDAMLWWLESEEGQRALANFDKGVFDPLDWRGMEAVRSGFGSNPYRFHRVLAGAPGSLKANEAPDLFWLGNPAAYKALAEAGDPDAMLRLLADGAPQWRGISSVKAPFLSYLTGFGDKGTFDAVEVKFWLQPEGYVNGTNQKLDRLVELLKSNASSYFRTPEGKLVEDAFNKRLDDVGDALLRSVTDPASREALEKIMADPTLKRGIVHHFVWDNAEALRARESGTALLPALAQAGDEAVQGVYIPGKRYIALFKDSDRSTFLHETGHDFLFDLMDRTDMGDTTAAGMVDTLTTWSGKGLTDWGVDEHEKFARTFEEYWRKGNSPNPELNSTFSYFKRWLTEIYKALVGKGKAVPGSDLSKEVRAMFDEMFAAGGKGDGLPKVGETARFAGEPGTYDTGKLTAKQLTGMDPDTPDDKLVDNLTDAIAKRVNDTHPTMGDVAADAVDQTIDRLTQRRPVVAPDGAPVNPAVGRSVVDWASRNVSPLYDDVATTAAQKAEQLANRVMLNGADQRGIDGLMGLVMPYSYFWSRSTRNWAQRAFRHPTWSNFYHEQAKALQGYDDQNNRENTSNEGRIPIWGKENGDVVSLMNPLDFVAPWAMLFDGFAKTDGRESSDAGIAMNSYLKATPGLFPTYMLAYNEMMDAKAPLPRGQKRAEWDLESYIPQLGAIGDLSMAATGKAPFDNLTYGIPFGQQQGAQAGVFNDPEQLERETQRAAARAGLETPQDAAVLQFAQQVAYNIRQGAPETDGIPEEYQVAALLAHERASKEAGMELLLRGMSYFTGLAVSTQRQADAALDNLRDTYQDLAYDEQTNPYGSKQAQWDFKDENPALPLAWNIGGNSKFGAPGLAAQSNALQQLINITYDAMAVETERVLSELQRAGEAAGVPLTRDAMEAKRQEIQAEFRALADAYKAEKLLMDQEIEREYEAMLERTATVPVEEPPVPPSAEIPPGPTGLPAPNMPSLKGYNPAEAQQKIMDVVFAAASDLPGRPDWATEMEPYRPGKDATPGEWEAWAERYIEYDKRMAQFEALQQAYIQENIGRQYEGAPSTLPGAPQDTAAAFEEWRNRYQTKTEKEVRATHNAYYEWYNREVQPIWDELGAAGSPQVAALYNANPDWRAYAIAMKLEDGVAPDELPRYLGGGGAASSTGGGTGSGTSGGARWEGEAGAGDGDPFKGGDKGFKPGSLVAGIVAGKAQTTEFTQKLAQAYEDGWDARTLEIFLGYDSGWSAEQKVKYRQDHPELEAFWDYFYDGVSFEEVSARWVDGYYLNANKPGAYTPRRSGPGYDSLGNRAFGYWPRSSGGGGGGGSSGYASPSTPPQLRKREVRINAGDAGRNQWRPITTGGEQAWYYAGQNTNSSDVEGLHRENVFRQ